MSLPAAPVCTGDRTRVFLAGLAVFTVASLACGLAQSQQVLVAARFVQGVGGAMTSAVVLGMIVTMFPEPREQAKAIGVYASVASAGGSVGRAGLLPACAPEQPTCVATPIEVSPEIGRGRPAASPAGFAPATPRGYRP